MTSTGPIGPNDTIADVQSKLKNPIPYIRGVIDKLTACKHSRQRICQDRHNRDGAISLLSGQLCFRGD